MQAKVALQFATKGDLYWSKAVGSFRYRLTREKLRGRKRTAWQWRKQNRKCPKSRWTPPKTKHCSTCKGQDAWRRRRCGYWPEQRFGGGTNDESGAVCNCLKGKTTAKIKDVTNNNHCKGDVMNAAVDCWDSCNRRNHPEEDRRIKQTATKKKVSDFIGSFTEILFPKHLTKSQKQRHGKSRVGKKKQLLLSHTGISYSIPATETDLAEAALQGRRGGGASAIQSFFSISTSNRAGNSEQLIMG